MVKKSSANSLGSLSFLFGVLIAIIVGLVSSTSARVPTNTLTSLLIVLGLIVGFLNITKKETNKFLMASVSLVIVSAIGGGIIGDVLVIGQYIEGILVSLITFVVPAAIVVALKAIYSLEEN